MLLEVIVTSRDEAVEAQAGGAGRLELVRSLQDGGLTPSSELVRDVLQALTIPVRVMLRGNASMSLDSPNELASLKAQARGITRFPIDGFVLGFIKTGAVDLEATREILAVAPNRPATFHRAFDDIPDPIRAIADLKTIPQIDRILTSGGSGSVPDRLKRLLEWQSVAAPEIAVLAAVGLCPLFLDAVRDQPTLSELHVGRAARSPETYSGSVSRHRVAALRKALR